MQTTKIFLILSLVFATIAITACESKDDGLFDSQAQVVEKEIDGIAFKFCLLNEKGEPATVFKKGENFSFYFSVTNKTEEELFFFPDFAYSNENGFCEVFSSDNQKIGKPFICLYYAKIGIGAYPFNAEESYVFRQQWEDKRNSIWHWKYGSYESNHQKPLPKGDYFTEFQSRFRLEHQHKDTNNLDTTLTFQIKFKVQ